MYEVLKSWFVTSRIGVQAFSKTLSEDGLFYLQAQFLLLRPSKNGQVSFDNFKSVSAWVWLHLFVDYIMWVCNMYIQLYLMKCDDHSHNPHILYGFFGSRLLWKMQQRWWTYLGYLRWLHRYVNALFSTFLMCVYLLACLYIEKNSKDIPHTICWYLSVYP